MEDDDEFNFVKKRVDRRKEKQEAPDSSTGSQTKTKTQQRKPERRIINKRGRGGVNISSSNKRPAITSQIRRNAPRATSGSFRGRGNKIVSDRSSSASPFAKAPSSSSVIESSKSEENQDVLPEARLTGKEKFEAELESYRTIMHIPSSEGIKSIEISTISYEKMRRMAVVKINNSNTSGPGSVNDPLLGSAGPNDKCAQCGDIGCPGHYGYIDFPEPIYNPLALRDIIYVLNSVCNKCSKLLLSKTTLEKAGIKGFGPNKLKAISMLAEKGSYCPTLGKKKCHIQYNDKGKMVNTAAKCAKAMSKKKAEIIKEIEELKAELRNDKTKNPEQREAINKAIEDAKEDINNIACDCEGNVSTNQGGIKDCPSNFKFCISDSKKAGMIIYTTGDKDKSKHLFPIEEVIEILSNISPEDIKTLGFQGESAPINLIMRGIFVIPINARPPNYIDGKETQNVLTNRYIDIYKAAHELPESKSIQEKRIAIYEAVSRLLVERDTTSARATSGPQVIADLITGKDGVLRKSLMATRTGNFFRTVASPDTSLRTDEIRVPEIFKRRLVKEIKVNLHNLDMCQDLFDKGKVVHIIKGRGKFQGVMRDVTKYQIDNGKIILQSGDIIYRELRDGDIIAVNRHPTLHKNSLIAFRVVLGPWETAGANLAVTKGFNLDFDGDEINGWVPLSVEVDNEVWANMGTVNNMISGRDNKPIIAPMMNAPTFAQRLTRPGVVVKTWLISNIISGLTDLQPYYRSDYEFVKRTGGLEDFDLFDFQNRLRKNGVPFNSGRALFSLAFPRDFTYEYGEGNKPKSVYVSDGVLVYGVIDKSSLSDNHRSMVQEIHKRYGKEKAQNFVSNIVYIIDKWSTTEGQSVGISDCISYNIEDYIYLDKDDRIVKKEKRVNALEDASRKEIIKAAAAIEALEAGLSDNSTAAEKELIENKIKTRVQNVINVLGKKAENLLEGFTLLLQAMGGGKGKIENVAQLGAAPGQQHTHGQRFMPTLRVGKVVIPLFDPDEKSIESRGMASHSFIQGMNVAEFFFHATASREGMIDTAINTAPAGALQRSLIKNMEDIIIFNDGSVRKTNGQVISIMYGNDGFETKHLLKKSFHNEDLSVPVDINSIANYLNSKRGWISGKQVEKMNDNLEQIELTEEGEFERSRRGLSTYTISSRARGFIGIDERVQLKSSRLLRKEYVKDKREMDKKAALIKLVNDKIRELRRNDPDRPLTEIQKSAINALVEQEIENMNIEDEVEMNRIRQEVTSKYDVNLVRTLAKIDKDGNILEVDRTLEEMAETLLPNRVMNDEEREELMWDIQLDLLKSIPMKTNEVSKLKFI